MGEVSQDLKSYIDAQLNPIKAEAAVAKADAAAAREAQQASRESERQMKEQLQQYKDRADAMAAELMKAQAMNLPLCMEPGGMGNTLRENFIFVRELRRSHEAINRVLASMEQDDSEDCNLLNEQAEKITKMLDLRLVAFHAAMQAACNQKMEFVVEYYRRFLPKISKTSGKFAPGGEKSISEIQVKEAQEISDRLVKQAASNHNRGHFGGRDAASGSGGGFGFKGGRGDKQGKGRGAGRGLAPAPGNAPAPGM